MVAAFSGLLTYNVIGVVRSTPEPVGSCVTMYGRFGSNADAVLKVLEKGARWLPARSVLSAVATTVMTVLSGQLPGRNTIRLSAERGMLILWGTPPAKSPNVRYGSTVPFIDSENINVTVAKGPTSTVPSLGVTDMIVGAVVSNGAEAVVNDENVYCNGLLARSVMLESAFE